MRGNFTHGRPMSLKRRIQSLRDQNARLAKRDQSNRCANCKAVLKRAWFTAWGDAQHRYCCALCVPKDAA